MTPARDLVIFGAWYFSHVIADAADLAGWSLVGCVDPDPPDGVETLTTVPGDASVFAAIGDNATRALVCDRLEAGGRELATIVHPTAAISRRATLGAGCYVGEHAVIRSNSVVGRGVVINAGAVISHDCAVGDFVAFGPNAAIASHVEIGARSLVGVGASVRPWVRIGRDCVIGAGAAVVANLQDGVTSAGVPARPIGAKTAAGRQSDWQANTTW